MKRSYISSYGVDENKPQSEEVKEDDEKMEDNLIPQEVAPISCSKQLLMVSQLMLFLLLLEKILLLLQSLGSAYSCLVNYKAQEAINLFQQLPLSHRNSPRVLIYLGQAMMLKEDFLKARDQITLSLNFLCTCRQHNTSVMPVVRIHTVMKAWTCMGQLCGIFKKKTNLSC